MKNTAAEVKVPFPEEPVIERVNLEQVPVKLMSDLNRYSNGFLPFGYSLGTFTHEHETGTITASGRVIAVSIHGRIWEFPLDEVIAAVLEADQKREESL